MKRVRAIGLAAAWFVWAGSPAIFAVDGASPPKIEVAITAPAEDGFGIWINQEMPVAALVRDVRCAGGATGYTIGWTATGGGFTDPHSGQSTFIAPDYSGPAVLHLTLIASARDVNNNVIAKSQVSSQTGVQGAKGREESRLALGKFIVLAAEMADTPAAVSATQAAADKSVFDNNWRHKIGSLPATQPEAFIHELVAASRAGDRDSRVEHLQRALALRPEDPNNIILEFNIATALSQNVDPAHHQDIRPKDALPYFKHIVEHYDHKAYYHADSGGGYSDCPSMLVPRAAILLSELTREDDQAKAYIDLAMKDLDWTFRTRTQEWASVPKPVATTGDDPFEWRPRDLAREIAAWEKKKADAAAGKAIGPYENALAEAAVRKLVGRHEGDAEAALQGVVDRFPGSPLATAAVAQADALGLSLDAASVATRASQPAAASLPGATHSEPVSHAMARAEAAEPGSNLPWVIGLVLVFGVVFGVVVYLVYRRSKGSAG